MQYLPRRKSALVLQARSCSSHVAITGHCKSWCCRAALMRLGNEASNGPLPLQSTHTASQHALEVFTDFLRRSKGAGIFLIALVKPAGPRTPAVTHAKFFVDVDLRLPPPAYDSVLATLRSTRAATCSSWLSGRSKAATLRSGDACLSAAGIRLSDQWRHAAPGPPAAPSPRALHLACAVRRLDLLICCRAQRCCHLGVWTAGCGGISDRD